MFGHFSTLCNKGLIENVTINEGDSTCIVKNSNSNKSHDWDNLFIRKIKICGPSITYTLKVLFIDSLQGRIFPESWKKANIVPVHKKESKILIKNYRPISLLQMFGKIFERLIFNAYLTILLKTYFLQNINRVFYEVTHASLIYFFREIKLSFNCAPGDDVNGVFLNIFKVLDKVWHPGLLYKLESYEVKGKFTRSF